MAASAPSPAAFAKGLAGVVAGQTAICSLDGTLRYRGYDIEPLARTGDFEEVAHLLWHGELPTRPNATPCSSGSQRQRPTCPGR